jgi:adenylate cyclase
MAQRKLAAILAADVAGYSGLMERDEAGALAAVKAAFAVLDPRVAAHGGRVFKLMGDGALAEFASVVEAVECALAVQAALAETSGAQLRIGVNVGDVVVEGDDIFGDGVNVAARLQGLASPGGVAISRTVREQIAGKIEGVFDDIGEHQVKSIERPLHVFAWGGDGVDAAPRLSVCVLPFENMSGDPEQTYFSDGVTEDILTELTKVSALKVASRTSTFALKGKTLSVGDVSRRLRCRYVLEGSVRKAGNRVRITAQLIDGANDSHLWAERYDRDLDDIFALQTEIAEAIAAALKAKILPAEKEKLEARATTNAEAYKLFLMARHYHVMGSERTDRIVERLCARAAELDPNYARVWALMAITQTKMHYRAATEDTGEESARRAIAIDPDLAEGHAALGRVLANDKHYDEAVAEHELALKLDPGSYDAHALAARTFTVMRRHAEAVHHFERAAALVEADYAASGMLIQNYEAVGDIEGALNAARRALARIEKVVAAEPDHGTALGHGVGVLAVLGETDRAKDWAERAMLLDPENRTLRYNLACAMVKLGENERALDYLDSAMRQSHQQALDWALADTDLDPLRDMPRYQDIMRAAQERVARDEHG